MCFYIIATFILLCLVVVAFIYRAKFVCGYKTKDFVISLCACLLTISLGITLLILLYYRGINFL